MYKIFFGGISQDTTEQDLFQYFSRYGRVVHVKVVYSEDTGSPA